MHEHQNLQDSILKETMDNIDSCHGLIYYYSVKLPSKNPIHDPASTENRADIPSLRNYLCNALKCMPRVTALESRKSQV